MKRLHLIAAIALVLGAATLACASGDAGHGAEAAHHGLNWKDFLFRVINFILVFGLIAWLAGKKIAGFFRGRRAQIENQLTDLDSRKAEAQKRLAEIEASIGNLEAEKKRIEDEYRQQGMALRDSIVAAAEAKAAQIRQQAQVTAAAEAKAAVEKIRAELADAVVDAAKTMLAQKLTDKDQEKLVDEYLTKVVFN